MKKLFALFLALAMVMGLCGCAASGDAPLAYGLILTEDTPYQQQIRAGYEAAAGKAGLQVLVRYAATVEDQISAIRDMIQKDVCGIAISPADSTGLEEALKDASSAGICTIAVNRDTQGADYYINHFSPEATSQAFLDEISEQTGGNGTFTLITYGKFSGMNVYINAMEQLIREEKYQNLTWVRTIYCDEEAELPGVLAELEACDVIYCTQSNLTPLLAEELKGTGIKLTGLAVPSTMKDLTGPDSPCQTYYFWDYTSVGSCAAALISALAADTVQDPESFTTTDGTVFPIYDGMISDFMVYSGPPIPMYENTAE